MDSMCLSREHLLVERFLPSEPVKEALSGLKSDLWMVPELDMDRTLRPLPFVEEDTSRYGVSWIKKTLTNQNTFEFLQHSYLILEAVEHSLLPHKFLLVHRQAEHKK